MLYVQINKKDDGNWYSNDHLIVRLERNGVDMYGNPLYKVFPVNFEIHASKQAYRNYVSKGYYLMQSYNIEWDMSILLDNLDRTYDFETSFAFLFWGFDPVI